MDNTDITIHKTIKKNKDIVQEYNKLFFEKNKERKYYCELCNCEVSFFNQSHHKNTKKHKLLLEKEDKKDSHIKLIEEKDKYIKFLEEKIKGEQK